MSLRDLRRHRDALHEFHVAYIDYVEGGPHGDRSLRQRVVALAADAESAMTAARIAPALQPGVYGGGVVIRGLTNLMLRHEQPGYRSMNIPQEVLDWCQLADARLAEQEEGLRRRYRNPLYWIDRFLRALFGIPAYLVSVLLRMPKERVDASIWGAGLRVISAAGAIAGIYFGGSDAGWW